MSAAAILPSDYRARQGGLLFLIMLLVFFTASLLLYGAYVASRLDDPYRGQALPRLFLVSTACFVAISVMTHAATRTVRRDRLRKTTLLLTASGILAVAFLAMQVLAMLDMFGGIIAVAGNGGGLGGMVVVLAFLHALHVAGGVIALGLVAARSALGRYDHERHFAVDFTAHYWHFLDAVWLIMLAAFWLTTGGF